MGRPSKGNSRPVVEPVLAMEKYSVRNWLCGIFLVLTAIIVCVASIVSTERATELGYMNCVRLSTAPHVACFSFSAFLVVAIMFQPAQNATASVTHRGIFSKVALLFVCAIAIAAASIGYPSEQDVCSNCTCGACQVFLREEREELLREEQVLDGCAEKERFIAGTSNAATGSESNTPLSANSNALLAMTRASISRRCVPPRKTTLQSSYQITSLAVRMPKTCSFLLILSFRRRSHRMQLWQIQIVFER